MVWPPAGSSDVIGTPLSVEATSIVVAALASAILTVQMDRLVVGERFVFAQRWKHAHVILKL